MIRRSRLAGAAAAFSLSCATHRAPDDVVVYTVTEPSSALVCQNLWHGLTTLADEFIMLHAAGSATDLTIIDEEWSELVAAPATDDDQDRLVEVYDRYRAKLGPLELRRLGEDTLCGRAFRENGVAISECVRVDVVAATTERLGLCGTRD